MGLSIHGLHGLQVKGSKEDRDKNMRKLIYSLLSTEGSFTAQKVYIQYKIAELYS